MADFIFSHGSNPLDREKMLPRSVDAFRGVSSRDSEGDLG